MMNVDQRLVSVDGDILAVAVSDQLLAVAFSYRVVRVYRIGTNPLTEVDWSPIDDVYSFAVNGCDFSSSGRLLATCSQDGRAHCWDAEQSGLSRGHVSHDSHCSIRVCRFVPVDENLLVTGGDDDTAVLWNITHCAAIRQFVGHESSVVALDISNDGVCLVTGSSVGDIRLWQLSTGDQLMLIKNAHDLGVTCAQFRPSDNSDVHLLATGGNDDHIHIWRLNSTIVDDGARLEKIIELHGHAGNVMCLSWSRRGLLASGGGDKTLIVWDVTSAEKLARHCHHQRYVTCVTFSQDDAMLISGSQDKSIVIFSVDQRLLVSPIHANRRIENVDQSPIISTKSVLEWKSSQVRSWLIDQLGDDNNRKLLIDQENIDGCQLLSMTDTTLKEWIGIDSPIERRRLLHAIESLRLNECFNEFICPITHQLMIDPVVASDGFTYERSAIVNWLIDHRTSPMTNVPLDNRIQLFPNRALKSLIKRHSRLNNPT